MNSQQFIVDAKYVNSYLDDKNTVILDITREIDKHKYAKDNHIPGAIDLDTEELGPYNWNFFDAEECRDVFLSKGIDKNTHLILYSAHPILAYRVAICAYWLGVEQVKILDGGYNSWVKKNYAVENTKNIPLVKSDFRTSVPARPRVLVMTPKDVLECREKNPDLVLASIRNWEEYIGITEGSYVNEKAGEPAGAVYVGWENIFKEDKMLRNPKLFIERLIDLGLDKDDEIIFYCGTGWRSCVTYFIAKEYGWKNIREFDGSWYQWHKYREREPQKYLVQIGEPNTSSFKVY